MKFSALKATLLLTAGLLTACSENDGPVDTAADIILTNGSIYTVDENGTIAEAIAIQDGHIIAVGSSEEVARMVGPKTTVRDLKGKMVMPGLGDMHIHALEIIQPEACDLASEGVTLSELVDIIQGCIVKYNIPEGEWVPVLQWNPFEGNQPDAKYPTLRAALDAASSTRKVYLYGNDGHHGAGNSLAMASISPALTAETLETVYKNFKDLVAVDKQGNPSGGLNEGAHMLVGAAGEESLTPAPSVLMPEVSRLLAKAGITSIQDASVSEDDLTAYKWLDDNGGMTFHMRANLHYPLTNGHSDADLANVPTMIKWLEQQRDRVKGSSYIDATGTKLFADGVMEGNPYGHPPSMPIAAMLEPYNQPIYKIDPATGSATVTGYVDLDSPVCKEYRAAPADYEAQAIQEAFEKENGFLPKQCTIWSGTLEHSEALIKAYIQAATDAGFHVHVHTIAEKATHVAAEAFQAAKASADKQGLTQSLAHVQIADPVDLVKLGRLGVYVAYTYHWIQPIEEYEMTVIPFVDKVKGTDDLYNPHHKYVKQAYAVETAIKDGIIPVFGSDAPVDSRDPMPFYNMQYALTRSNDDDTVVMNPNEKISIEDAIASYTINGAKLMGREKDLGSLEVGKIADIIVIDRNIVDLAKSGSADEIGATKVLTTIFEGKIIYDTEK